MRVEVGDRVVVHGRHGTRIGVVVAGAEDGGATVHWADGGESTISAGTDAPEEPGRATWNAAKSGPTVSWRRGVTAGVGREASIAQEKLAAKEAAEHKPASGE
ncbi:MAG TPA: hypothetical protein VHF27_06325 [Acidimicrobiales bacterium]|nr:hypothetical protein [Acidimicrobiales bacterium]